MKLLDCYGGLVADTVKCGKTTFEEIEKALTVDAIERAAEMGATIPKLLDAVKRLTMNGLSTHGAIKHYLSELAGA